MTHGKTCARRRAASTGTRQASIPVALRAAGLIGVLVCTILVTGPAVGQATSPSGRALPVAPDIETAGDHTTVTIPAGADMAGSEASSGVQVWVPLPGNTASYRVAVQPADAAQVEILGQAGRMRGVQMLPLLVKGQAAGPLTITVRHDGQWGDGPPAPSRALHGPWQVPGSATGAYSPDKSQGSRRGTYLVVHAPAFTAQIAPLVDWKTRKGYRVATVSTATTGATTEGIKAFIQDAYDSWVSPPEYILLVGDVDEIPTYNLSGNPTDLPYTQLEGDDWLADALVGRLPVENDTEARTVINKIVAYERTPDLGDGTDWFTRSIMVAGVEGSETPPHTVRFCGEQLQTIGFDPAHYLLHPPLPSNFFIDTMFNDAVNNGASMVAYRGWAYGTSGWSDPRYEVNDMGGLANGAKLPVVMSFVCLNGDYTYSSPCFGEAWLRLGLPDQPRGAVAFIGNGEHWSHTRYNDAMAISFFETIVDPGITDLGSLMNTSKLRFAQFFPHQMEAADQEDPEESVEFYYHIYNLLGDPELDFWKSTPVVLDVGHPTNLSEGADHALVTVNDLNSAMPLVGAVVTAVRDGALLGSAVTDAAGRARVPFPPLEAGQAVEITVSGAGLVPFEATLGSASAAAFISLSQVQTSDSEAGNGDGVANPGEQLDLTLELRNTGTGNSGDFTLSVEQVSGPASLVAGDIACLSLASGQSRSEGPVTIQVLPAARQGDLITVVLDMERSGGVHDQAVHSFPVVAPGLTCLELAPAADEHIMPGTQTDLVMTLLAGGATGTSGGTVTLEMVPLDGATLTGNLTSFPACVSDAMVTTGSGLRVEVDEAVAAGTQLSFTATIETAEGQQVQTTCAVLVGVPGVGNVCGPDGYGYYAYDSADLEYPAGRPVYEWHEISTAMGGEGTKLNFPADNYVVDVQVDLPFTFTYYGQDYDRIRVADNGWISFDLAPNFNFYNWPLPSPHGNDAMVAPFWENLVPSGDGGDNGLPADGIYYHHDALAGTFTVEWSRLYHYQPEILGYQTFQVVLLDPNLHPTTSGDGEILFYYRDVNNNDHLRQYATVGLEAPSGQDGLQLSYSSVNAPGQAPLQPGLAIRLTTEPPVRVPYQVAGFSATTAAGQLSLAWRTADERPVQGWHVDRLENGQTTRLTEAPLAAAVRSLQLPADPDATGPVSYRLTALHPYGVKSLAGETSVGGTLASRLAIRKVSPNPGRDGTSVAFVMPDHARASLRVYDAAGRLVRTLLDGTVNAGENLQMWDGRDDHGSAAAGGLYFFRLESAGQNLTRKFVLVR